MYEFVITPAGTNYFSSEESNVKVFGVAGACQYLHDGQHSKTGIFEKVILLTVHSMMVRFFTLLKACEYLF